MLAQIVYTGNEFYPSDMANPNCSYVRGQNVKLVQGRTNVERARGIAKTLGAFTAARYLAKRGFSVEMAVNILLNK